MEMIRTARRYPQFVLPLPRDIVGEDADTANVAPGEKKTGFEMQFMEWGFLPPPKPAQPSVSSSDTGAPTSMPNGGAQPERDAIPSTVLFTPLAEYKLRQEYAQPLLVLTHYTDLIASKGIVLMRGEITGADEVDAAPTGIVAAAAAAKAGASEEEQQRLAQPVKSQGRMSQQDAQLLSMCMQRFYLPKLGSADSSRRNETDTGAQERADLLASFHENPTKFDVDQLVAAAYQF